MRIALLVLALLATHNGAPHAKFYEQPGLMRQVALNRGLTPVNHMASVPDCSRIGDHVLAVVNGHRALYKVVDCSAPRDRARHIRQGLVIEVDYYSAHEFGFAREGHAPAHIIRFYNW